MDKERKQQVLNAIKKRESVNKIFLSVRKMLCLNNMEDYANVCISRVLHDEQCDDEFSFVIYDFLNDDIIVDSIGIGRIAYILQGFMDKEKIDEFEEWLSLQNSLVEAQNDQIELLRNASNEVIKKTLSIYKCANDEEYSDLCELCRAELKSRKPINMFVQQVRKKIHRFVLCAEHWNVIFTIKRATIEIEK